MQAQKQLRGERELNSGSDAKVNSTTVAVWAQEARAIGGGGFGREGQEAKYGTLGANPMVL